MKLIIKYSLLLLFLTGCHGSTFIQPTGEASKLFISSPTLEISSATPLYLTQTLTMGASATPDQRLPPERWQEWPVIPVLTGKAIEIYMRGQALGNNPQAFSKVGDCQSVKAAFMGYLDIPERVPDTPEYQILQETIDNFSGYFNTDGQAVKGGFNAATVLSPLWANPEICLAGENPLECELRVTKPIIVFISFEVWWEGRTAKQYEAYMRKIIETTIAHGAVPVLATKADNVEGDHSINLTTARLAHEYDIPLYNFWAAVQHLPYHGLDPERDDGFHISTEAWNVHSFTGLQTLDAIWRGLQAIKTSGSLLPTESRSPVESFGLLPIPEGDPKLGDSSDQIVFGVTKRERSTYQSIGVFLFDLNKEKKVGILGDGWDFQGASQHGKKILVNFDNFLYTTDGLTLNLVSSNFYHLGNTSAMFIDDESIITVEETGTGTALVRISPDGSDFQVLTKADEKPIELYPSSDGEKIVWESGSCSSFRVCERQGPWLTNLLSNQSFKLSNLSRPLIAPDGSTLAYEYISGENTTDLGFASLDGNPTRIVQLYGDILEEFAWEPGSEWLAVYMALRSNYSGRVSEGTNFLVDPHTLETRQFPSVLLLNPRLVWSGDGQKLIWLGTNLISDQYNIALYEVDIRSGMVTNLSRKLDIVDLLYIFVSNGYWLR